MNKNIAVALFRDAFAQVVDNMMFKILLGLLMLCVLPTFLFGFQDDALVVLFYWRFPYDELLTKFGGSGALDADVRIGLIRGTQSTLVDVAAGKLGILLSIAATAFFVPRMLERGAADTLFSKPVSRLSLMLSRYFAGLIFVSILAILLVGGMHVGLLVSSGYSDPGFLWSIPTLIYVYSVMHAVSVMVGVFTRSSVAALLLTMIFFIFNSCVHTGWEMKDAGASNPIPQVEDTTPTERTMTSLVIDTMVAIFDGLHYTLPKTGDATRMAKLARRQAEDRKREFVDSGRSDFMVETAPAGFTRDTRSSLVHDGVLWISDDPGHATVRLRLRPMDEVKSRSAEGRRIREELESDPGVTVIDDGRLMLADKRSEYVEWHEERDSEQRLHKRWDFASGSKWLLTLEYDAELTWASEDAQEAALQDFLDGLHFPELENPFDRPSSYERKFGFDAEWKYSAWFSIATTLAFLLAALLLGWWKLTRIDF